MLAIQRYTAMGALDAGFWVYRQHFTLLFTLSLIVALPTAVVSAGLSTSTQGAQDDPSALPGMLAWLALVLVVAMAGSAFVTAASTRVASSVALGKHPSLASTLRETMPVLGKVLRATLLVGLGLGGLTVLGAFVIALGVFAFAVGGGDGPGAIAQLAAVVLGVGLVVAMAMLWLRWSLAIPIAAIEPGGARVALQRSSDLTRGRKGKIFLAMLVFGMAAMVVQGGVLALGLLVPGEGFGSELIKQLLSGGGSAVASPVAYVAIALLYYDARVEREAFDVETLARQSEAPGAV